MQTLLLLALAVAPAITALECGIANSDPSGSARVVNGQAQTYFKYPWYAVLHHANNLKSPQCGGTLISPEWVMTAGHCFDHIRGSLKEYYHVTLGIFDKCKETPTAVTYKTSEVHVHPLYIQTTELYDIALMKLDGVSDLTPVCLPAKGAPIEHVDIAHVAGFGVLAFGEHRQPCEINEATVEIFTAEECKYDTKYFSYITNKIEATQAAFCAGKLEGGPDTCQGDSGGALLVEEEQKYFARGIVSFGEVCGREYYPGIYTNVAFFIDWINNTMQGIHEVHKPKPTPKPTKPKIKGCGVANSDPYGSARVVGGRPETFLKFPWFAAIHRPNKKSRQTCAGTLIQPRHVMTAASCFDEDLGIPLEEYFHVTLGTFSQCKNIRGAFAYKTEKVYIHPKYEKNETFHDIAILKLDGATELTPACLPGRRAPINHVNNATILGFGRLLEDTEDQPCVINEATVEIYTNEECLSQSNLPEDLVRTMVQDRNAFCAGKMEGGAGTCMEDQGGSILTYDYQRYFAKGIVVSSRGFGCGEKGMPSIFTDVSSYMDWIFQALRGALDKMDQRKSKKKSSHKRSSKFTAG